MACFQRKTFLGRLHARWANPYGSGRRRLGEENGEERGRGNSLDVHGPGWNERRIRYPLKPGNFRRFTGPDDCFRRGWNARTFKRSPDSGTGGCSSGGCSSGGLNFSLPATHDKRSKRILEEKRPNGQIRRLMKKLAFRRSE